MSHPAVNSATPLRNDPQREMRGHVVAVRGTVIDVAFPDGLPPLETALSCDLGEHQTVAAVVNSHLGDSQVRAIAISSTRGMHRGAAVSGDGLPLRIPVGRQLLGRVIDPRGQPLGGGR
jgi:F-type H+/Na+-transporting ATPase subunit beta